MFKEFKTFSVFLIACLISLPAVVLADDEAAETAATTNEIPVVLSIESIIDLVKTQNIDIFIQKDSVRRALERTYQTRAALLPQISLDASQSRINQRFNTGFNENFSGTDPFNVFDAKLVASVSLIDPDAYAAYRLARFDHSIAEMDYEIAQQDILEQVIQLYITHLRNMREVELVRGNITRARSLLDLARDQYDAGVAIKLDVTRAEVRVATEQRNLMQAEVAVDDTLLQIKSLLDIDLNEEVEVDRSVIEVLGAPPLIDSYSSLKHLVEERAEVKSQMKTLEQARLARRAASWQRLPTASLFGEWGVDSETAFDGEEQEGWLLGVSVSLPIFEGGRIAAEKREADLNVRQQEHRMRLVNNAIDRQFRFALLNMQSRYAQIEIAREEIRLGKDELQQAEERYREGLGDNREVIDAQQSLADAESSHLFSSYLYGLSRLAFARAIGRVEAILD